MSKPVPSNTLLNPFELPKEKILDKVYMTHFQDVETYDVESLYSVASNIIKHSNEAINKIDTRTDRVRSEDAGALTSFPRFRSLKRIASQMICTPRGERHAHQTTILILQQLRAYPWNAKAVIVLAAFALEYGQFWHLAATPRDELGKSLAELNGLQGIQENKQQLVEFNSLVNKAKEVIEYLNQWKTLTTAEHDLKDVPDLPATLQEIPVIVYWAIITFVACASHLDFMGDKDYKCELSQFGTNLDTNLNNFKNRLDKCEKQIGAIQEYNRRVNDVRNGKNIVTFLRALIIPSDAKDPNPIAFNVGGTTRTQVGVEEFDKKHVLLFISGLGNIEHEIELLNSIYDRLNEEPKEVQNYRKEDFKILWIPMVNVWNDIHKQILRERLENTQIGWYVVKEFSFSTGKRLIKEIFKYKNTPIIPLISPEGKIVNPDAKQILSEWGIDGFPFKDSDHIRLTQQWNWFWGEMINLSPGIKKLIEKNCYIFIYGGTNTKWLERFTKAVEELKKHDTIIEQDIIIEVYPFGKDNPKIVPRFWIAIDSLLASKKQMKVGEEVSDSATTQIKKLVGLKHDPQGWVLLSKGPHMKLMGQGKAMCNTVEDFDEKWKQKLSQKKGRFDVAFIEYYKSQVKDFPEECTYSEHENYPTDILAQISCPHPQCQRLMEVDSVNYKCCHGREGDKVLDSVTQFKI